MNDLWLAIFCSWSHWPSRKGCFLLDTPYLQTLLSPYSPHSITLSSFTNFFARFAVWLALVIIYHVMCNTHAFPIYILHCMPFPYHYNSILVHLGVTSRYWNVTNELINYLIDQFSDRNFENACCNELTHVFIVVATTHETSVIRVMIYKSATHACNDL